MNAKLIINTDEGVREIELIEHNTIGRYKQNRILIADNSVSKDHSVIFSGKDNNWVIKDLGSANGTFVNNKRITGETILNDNDVILFGKINCVFLELAGPVEQMVEVCEGTLQTNIHTKGELIVQDKFLPESELTDEKILREDYEKLRLTYELQRDIGSSINIDMILERILERTFQFLNCDRGVILLSNGDGDLKPKSYKTRKKSDKLIVSSTIINHIKKEMSGIISSDILTDERFNEAESMKIEGVRSTIATPILYEKELLGIAIIDSSESVNAFMEKDLNILSNIANHAAQFIKNSLLHEELRLCFMSSIKTLSAMVDAKHPMTVGHSQRVTEISLMIAKEMGLSIDDMESLKFSSILHDIGKIGIRDDVLSKQGSFTIEEKAAMDKHPVKTKDILKNFRFPSSLQHVPELAAFHHEKVNGEGYPFGLTGDQIPLISKVLMVADVFDALTSQRDYPKYLSGKTYNKEQIPLDKVISIMKSDTGSHFEAEVMDAFIKCLPSILLHYRASHFSPEYVDCMIKTLAPDIPL